MRTNKRRVIVEVDSGTDDAHALLILLHAEKLGEIAIEGICCSMGNASREDVCKNVIRILETVNRTDIPVYKGCAGPLIPSEHKIRRYHGEDGFGDLKHEKEPNINIIKETPSAIRMAEIVEQFPGEITLICLGPLTNVAIAMRLYDNFAKNLKDIYLMGGNYTAVGNVTPAAEYNFYVDPEGAYIVLECAVCPVYICTWECCLYTKIPFEWRWNVLGSIQNPVSTLLTRAEKSVYYGETNTSIWFPCDAFLAAILLRPDKVIKKKSEHHATVELHGSKTRGQIVLDHLKTKTPNVIVIESVDYEYFKDFIFEVHKEFTQN